MIDEIIRQLVLFEMIGTRMRVFITGDKYKCDYYRVLIAPNIPTSDHASTVDYQNRMSFTAISVPFYGIKDMTAAEAIGVIKYIMKGGNDEIA